MSNSKRIKKTKKPVKRIPENENEFEVTKKYKIKTKKNHRKFWKVFKITILLILLLIIIAAGIVIGKLYGIFKEAKLNMEEIVIKYENSEVKDINGDTIAILNGSENREIVTMSEMSPYLPKAFVAIEDERFYEHKGVDIKRTGAATVTYILHRGKSSFGGSTITQQLIKNLTEEDDRTWQRKVKEMARAYYLEQELSKSQVLELYLNLIFLGGRAYGVEVASQYYFSKNAKDLTLAESAYLAGINNSPNLYRPFSEDENDINKIKARTKIVLDKMHELGRENPSHHAAITDEEYNTAMEQLNNGLQFQKGEIIQTIYSYHTDAAINQVKSELKAKNDWTEEYADRYVKSGGLTIYTTQNTEIQHVMEEEATKDKYAVYSRYNKDEEGNAIRAQAAMVLIDHKTGYVLATIGGLGEKTMAFGLNRATQSVRQPGSSMKPLAVLCPGIDNGVITAASVFDDIPYTSGRYQGFKDYGRSYTGLTTLRHNTAQSKNIPMLKAINEIGVERSVAFLKSAGITSILPEQENMTIALGSADVSPLEMAGAYAAIANDGVYIKPTFYTKVVDSEGNVVLQAEQETRTIMSSSTAYIVKEILTEVVRSGAGGYAGISGISVGVKTGTSNDDYDRWFCGFTPYYTAAAWFGYDKKEQVIYNSNPAGYLWDGVMEQIHQGLPAKKFSDTRPSNVTTATICRASGKLATELCGQDPRGNQVYTEYFVKGTVPTEQCTCHVKVKICTATGLLANDNCPATEEKVFITRSPAETGNWSVAADAKYMLTITETCTTHFAPPTPVTPPVEVVPVIPSEPEQPTGQEQPQNTTGGNTSGSNTTGGNTTGGNTTGGNTTGGNTTGGNTADGNTTDGNSTGGDSAGGNTAGENTSGGNTSGNNTTP